MIHLIPSDVVRDAAKDYARMVETRRAVSGVDPISDTLEYVARDLVERAGRAEKALDRLSAEQYAALARVSPQTVCRWCRRGELPGAEHTARGWLIPQGAERAKRKPAGRRRLRRVA